MPNLCLNIAHTGVLWLLCCSVKKWCWRWWCLSCCVLVITGRILKLFTPFCSRYNATSEYKFLTKYAHPFRRYETEFRFFGTRCITCQIPKWFLPTVTTSTCMSFIIAKNCSRKIHLNLFIWGDPPIMKWKQSIKL